MTTRHLCSAGLLLMIGAAACNNNGTPANGTSGNSTVTTVTTTTVRHKYGGSFTPRPSAKYIDLKTNKEVVVKIDTTLGEIVNDETDLPVDLFVEPITHDTISGLTGTVVNNMVIHDPNGDMYLDTVKISQLQTTATDPGLGKEKYKEKANGKIKYKDDEEKVKERNGVQITTQK